MRVASLPLALTYDGSNASDHRISTVAEDHGFIASATHVSNGQDVSPYGVAADTPDIADTADRQRNGKTR
jgi:hypothetical protein